MKRRRTADRIVAFFRPRGRADPGLLLSRERFVAAQTLVSAYYAVLFFLSVSNLFSWPAYLKSQPSEPRWPVFWLHFVEPEHGIAVILWLHLLGGLLAVTLARYRVVRALVCVALLELLAFRFSFGSINHGDHLGTLIAFVLIFLPAGWHQRSVSDRRTRAATLLVFSGCQAMILLTYSMAGAWKAAGVLEQWLRGEWITYLHPNGLAQQVAAKLLEDDATSLLGPWLIRHAWVGWLPGIAAIYLELFALWVVARPSLQRAWGLGLALLHVATHLLLGVGFPQNVLWLSLFLVLSPLQPTRASWQRCLTDLPLFGAFFKRWRAVA